MRPRFQADADFNQKIVAGLKRREPAVDLQDARAGGVIGLPDPEVLAMAAESGRILVSHDRRTMVAHFVRFVEGRSSPGLIIVPQDLKWVGDRGPVGRLGGVGIGGVVEQSRVSSTLRLRGPGWFATCPMGEIDQCSVPGNGRTIGRSSLLVACPFPSNADDKRRSSAPRVRMSRQLDIATS
jgi:hypothetical protein